MLSAANDGQIVVWGSGGSKVDEVTVRFYSCYSP